MDYGRVPAPCREAAGDGDAEKSRFLVPPAFSTSGERNLTARGTSSAPA
jgi:hypothetical protein